MSSEDPDWRQILIDRLRERNRKESHNYKDLIAHNNRLLDSTAQMKAENLKLNIENEQLRAGLSTGGHNSGESNTSIAKISHLEKKLLTQQEELTDLHKRKGENAQMIVDLNIKLEKVNKILTEKEKSLSEQISINHSLRAEVQMLNSSLHELKGLNTMLRDEHTALQLAFASLEEKLRKVQDENRALVERLIKYKAKDAEKMNEENETFLKKRTDRMRRDLEEAARENRRSCSPVPVSNATESCSSVRGSLNDLTLTAGAPTKMTGYYSDALPSVVHLKFDAHDGEINAVRWSPVERLVATGGADRKVKLWDVGKSVLEPRGTLVGSNAGVNSVDFDSTGSMILATSNDFASRVWTVADQRIRISETISLIFIAISYSSECIQGFEITVKAYMFVLLCYPVFIGDLLLLNLSLLSSADQRSGFHTLTGHSGKVMAAKFLGEPSKVVTGSHDRTLKIWDLRSKCCIETKFAGSSCNDLVTTDSSGSTIISGHFDKKIRFWDTRTNSSADDIELSGKITSLDLSKDCKYLLSCVRDDTLQLLDLRMNQIIGTFTNDNFKVGCDWARVTFNTDATRVAAGSADGSVYIWNVNGQLETILKEHTCAVTAVSWHPFSSALASVDRSKKCIIWVDA